MSREVRHDEVLEWLLTNLCVECDGEGGWDIDEGIRVICQECEGTGLTEKGPVTVCADPPVW